MRYVVYLASEVQGDDGTEGHDHVPMGATLEDSPEDPLAEIDFDDGLWSIIITSNIVLTTFGMYSRGSDKYTPSR